MKIKEWLGAILGVALLGVLGFVWWSDNSMEVAPEVSMKLIGGEQLSFGSLRGRPVMVTFWATTCGPCRKEIPHLKEIYEAYSPQGFEMIAVAMPYDPPAQVWEFMKQKTLPYKVALDTDGAVTEAFGAIRLTPTTFVISGDGRIVYHTRGEFDLAKMHGLVQQLLADA